MMLSSWIKNKLKKKSRLYLLPTAMGGYLNGLIVLMFFLSLGYGNNLLLIFTSILFGFNLIWLIQTHFYLNLVIPDSISVEDGYADEAILVSIDWKQLPSPPFEWEIYLENQDNQTIEIKHLKNDVYKTQGFINKLQRGLCKINYLQIKTNRPYGLYTAWIYRPIEIFFYVYPKRLKDYPPVIMNTGINEGEQLGLKKGEHDFWDLSAYQNDESRKISWKHYARSGNLLIKQGEEKKIYSTHFVVKPSLEDKEEYLQMVTSQMIYCEKSGVEFSLETSNIKTPLGCSKKHLIICLRELSKC